MKSKNFSYLSILFASCLFIVLVWPTIIDGHKGFGMLLILGIISLFTFGASIVKYWRSNIILKVFFNMFKSIKRWTLVYFFLSIFLVIITPSLFPMADDGIPSNLDGNYFIENHGKIVREISYREYLYEIRVLRIQILVTFHMFFAFGQMILNKTLDSKSK